MIKKIFLLYSLLLTIIGFANNGKSVPGYLGSKNAVSLKFQSNVAVSDDFLSQLLRPSVGATYERVINRRSSLSLGFGNSKNRIYDYAYYPFLDNRYNDLILDNTNSYTSLDGYVSYNNTYFNVSKSYYNLASGSIAPMGFYTKIGYTLNFQKITKDAMTYYIGANPNGNSLYKTQRTSSLNLEFGSNRFINKNIFIQKSIAFNLPFNFWSTSRDNVFNNIEDFNETYLNFYLSKARTFNISIGIGAAF